MVYYGYIVQICESIQSDVPQFYYTERDVERWRHKALFVMKLECYLWVSIKTPNHHQSWLQFPLSHHTLQHTNSITNPILAQINETFRQTVASCTNILVGGGGGGGLIFSHICRLRPFLGVQNLLISIVFGIFMYIYINESTPPPHTHTHTHTNTGHVRLSAPGFGAHRIYACADPDFHFFSSAYFTEGPIRLGHLPVSFFLTENYCTCINRPVREAHAWCAKVCFKGCGYPDREFVWNTCWLVCAWAWSDMVLWRFVGASTDPLVLYWRCCRYSCVYPGEGAGVSGSPLKIAEI